MDNEHLYNLYKIHSLSVIIKEREENETPEWKCYPFSFPFFFGFVSNFIFASLSFFSQFLLQSSKTDDDNDDDCCPAK